MNTTRVTAIGVALACIIAFGVASTTLESTVSSDPADVIDVGADDSVIPGSSAGAIRDQIESNKEQGSRVAMKRKEGGRSEPVGGGEGEAEQMSLGQDQAQGQGPGDVTESLVDRLLDLLRQLLVFFPVLLLVGLAGAAYRYRERLLAALPESATNATSDDPWDGATPSNAVERAWFEMVRHLDVDRPRSKTPAECAAAARDADMDPEGVRLVTRAFRRAQYAPDAPDEEHEETARRGLDRLGLRSRTFQ